jgi:hypothetical protein
LIMLLFLLSRQLLISASVQHTFTFHYFCGYYHIGKSQLRTFSTWTTSHRWMSYERSWIAPVFPAGLQSFSREANFSFWQLLRISMAFPTSPSPSQIGPSLELSMCAHNIMVPISKVAHINGCSSLIRTCSDVLNILAFLKTYAEERVPAADSIQFCISLLEETASGADDSLA